MKRLYLLLLMIGFMAVAKSQDITAAEYFFDTDPGTGNGTAITIASQGATVNFSAAISTASLSAGFHFACIRVKDANNVWSLFEKRGFYISSSTTNAADIAGAEYFFDADPGVGNGTAISVGVTGGIVNFTAVIPTSLVAGFHFLSIRVKDASGIWGHYEKRGFYISSSTADAANIIAAEYFFDSDPGIGNGTAVSVGTTGAVVNFSAAIPTSLSAGFHFLAIRTKDATGQWGLFEKRGFYISSATSDAANIVGAEYFFDNDPGVGNATAVSVGASGATVNFTAVLPQSLSTGFHFLAIRTKGADGVWGLFEKRGFYVSPTTINSADIVAAEFYFDADPGVGNGTPLTVTTPGAIITQTFAMPAGSLALGTHVLSIRVKGTDGKWGLYEHRTFSIGNSTITCPANTTANTNVGGCTAIVNSIDPVVSPVQAFGYTLSGATTRTGTGTASGEAFNAGVTTVTYALSGSPSVTCSFTVTVTALAPAITTQPSTQSVCTGANVTFSVVATGTGLTYQWRKGGVNIVGATGTSYTITSALAGDAGNYDVVISTTCATTVTSTVATLTVGATNISTQPTNQFACIGGNATFTVAATGSSLTYQWRKGGVNISGATAATFTITGVTAGDAANYDVVVGSTCGASTSTVATLTINPATNITTQPATQSVCAGSNATFNVAATGAGTLTYQWKKGGIDIAGATASAYTIVNTTAADVANYTVVVTGTCGSITSSIAALTVNAATSISTQPSNQSSCVGGSVTFNALGAGAGISYQWQKNGVPIAGATLANFTISSIVAGDAATYTVVVTGACGTVTSSGALLTITAGTTINTQPANTSACLGGSASFSVSASGSGTLTYQWKKNGVDMPGVIAAGFTLNLVTAGDVANYSVAITSSCGSVTSVSASLSLNATTVITVNPAAQSVCTGGNATFNVTATGTGGLAYQWKKNNVDISGATAAAFTINGVAATDAADYSVTVTATCGTVTSSSATLTVNAATSITTQPTNQSSCIGGSVTFNALGAGIAVTYQWQKNGVSISGATSASFTINPIIAGDAATYTVIVSGSCGSVTSAGAALSITAGTSINTQPANTTACLGGSASFSVSASGSGTLTYQWKKNGVDMPGITAASFTINPVSASDAANYSVAITSSCGTTTSATASLSLLTATAISTQPANQVSCVGGNATFTVAAAGTTLSFQWRKAGVNIAGATTASFTITGIAAADVANYDVIVTGTCGSVTSNTVSLSTNNPSITTQPASQTICAGGSVTFSVVSSGTGNTFQWRKGAVNINGATSAAFTIATTVAADAGNYTVVVNNSCGSVTSNAATLVINATPAINTQPVNQSVCAGASATFTVAATGSGLTYQWRKGGNNIAGATLATYTIATVAGADAGNYDVIVSGTCTPAATSAIATLTVSTAPGITAQPVNQSVCTGANVSFAVTATGTGLTYQWRKGGVNIAGANASSYNLTNVIIADGGNYDVIITSSSCGLNVTSLAATLTVNTSQNIVLQPIAPVCFSDTAFNLIASLPGGVWSGVGVTNNKFNPATSGIGTFSVTYTVTNAGCINRGSTNVVVNECAERRRFLNSNDGIIVYPNPNNGRFNIKLNSDLYKDLDITMYDINGRLVHRQSFAGLTYGSILKVGQVNVVNGVYVLYVSNGKGNFMVHKQFKIVIMR